MKPIQKQDEIIVSHPSFKKHLDNMIANVRKAFDERPAPKKGFKYRRTWVDRLIDKGRLNPEYFYAQSRDVLTYQSDLPAVIRAPMYDICIRAFVLTTDDISKEQKEILDPV